MLKNNESTNNSAEWMFTAVLPTVVKSQNQDVFSKRKTLQPSETAWAKASWS